MTDAPQVGRPKTRLGRAISVASRGGQTSSGGEPHRRQNSLRDVILGGQDGLVNILGIILGVHAGGGSTTVLLATGFAAAITESISMGAVGYTSSMSERDFYLAEQKRETDEIDADPDEERDEVRAIYAAKGFAGDLLDKVVATITANRETWVATMMSEELQLKPVDTGDILRTSVVITIATLIGHMIPLVPFLFLPETPALISAIVLSGLVLFGVGWYSAVTLVGDWRWSGLKFVIIGLGAAAIGYFVGRLFSAA
jgi:VIT1/CCC1 family predicted Fe2+/Mn2+ transporter